jgi:hypothetical protein
MRAAMGCGDARRRAAAWHSAAQENRTFLEGISTGRRRSSKLCPVRLKQAVNAQQARTPLIYCFEAKEDRQVPALVEISTRDQHFDAKLDPIDRVYIVLGICQYNNMESAILSHSTQGGARKRLVTAVVHQYQAEWRVD